MTSASPAWGDASPSLLARVRRRAGAKAPVMDAREVGSVTYRLATLAPALGVPYAPGHYDSSDHRGQPRGQHAARDIALLAAYGVRLRR